MSFAEAKLASDDIVDVAKEVVLSSLLACQWECCELELNSWKTLQEVLCISPVFFILIQS